MWNSRVCRVGALGPPGLLSEGQRAEHLQQARGRVTARHGRRRSRARRLLGQSSLAGYALATADNTVVVDSSVDLALAAPLGSGFQTGAGAELNVLAPKRDSWLALFGAGAVDMAALLAANTIDGLRTIVVETSPQRRDLAVELGLGAGTPPVDLRDPVMNGKNIRGCLEGDSVPAVFIPRLLELDPGRSAPAGAIGDGLSQHRDRHRTG